MKLSCQLSLANQTKAITVCRRGAVADRDEPGRCAADDSVSVVKPRRDLYPTAPTDVAEGGLSRARETAAQS